MYDYVVLFCIVLCDVSSVFNPLPAKEENKRSELDGP